MDAVYIQVMSQLKTLQNSHNKLNLKYNMIKHTNYSYMTFCIIQNYNYRCAQQFLSKTIHNVIVTHLT